MHLLYEKLMHLNLHVTKAKDFEDSVQYYAALRAGVDYIVSRNVRDYPFDDIPVVTPQDFFSIMGFE